MESVAEAEVAFGEGYERELWSHVLTQINDMLRNHIKRVSEVAISGPNRLDLTFPKSYHFNKQYCERPEVLSRLEEVTSKIAGKQVRISLFVSDDETPQAEEPKPAAESTVHRRDAGDDEYVQKAVSVFGATVVKVEGIQGERPGKE